MKKLNIEKKIILDVDLERLEDVSCHEKIQTTALSNGLECTGFIEINGIGIQQNHRIPIHELIDLSIFAPFDKLSDCEQFGVSLTEYQLNVHQNELDCFFTFEVNGIIENESLETSKYESASLEDLLDDSDVVNDKVRYVLTYNNDTYASIASRYGVDEMSLRSLNQDKVLSGRMLILLPLG